MEAACNLAEGDTEAQTRLAQCRRELEHREMAESQEIARLRAELDEAVLQIEMQASAGGKAAAVAAMYEPQESPTVVAGAVRAEEKRKQAEELNKVKEELVARFLTPNHKPTLTITLTLTLTVLEKILHI